MSDPDLDYINECLEEGDVAAALDAFGDEDPADYF